MNISNETVQELCGGIVPTYIKFTVLTLASSCRVDYSYPCGIRYDEKTFYLHTKKGYTKFLQNVVGSTKTISYNSTVGCSITGVIGTYESGYLTLSYFELPGSIKIEFLDENKNNILTSIEGPISAGLSSSNYTMKIPTSKVPVRIPFSIDDIQDKITGPALKSEIPIDYEGLSYSGLSVTGEFIASGKTNAVFLTLIPLTSGQKIGFCIGETVSNRLRASFFSGKTYNSFSTYIKQSTGSSARIIYSDGINLTGGPSGASEPSGDGLLQRLYYTAPADGVLIVHTSGESKLAYLHVWEA